MSYIILIICTIFIIVGIVLITITGNSNENFKIDGIDVPLVKMGDSREYKKNFILPTKQLKFENITVNVPNKFNEFSKLNYRDFPPALLEKSKRRPHEGGGYVDPFKTCEHHYKMYPKLYK